MDYLITFDDGSDAVLSHHGVKGMHWGIWNAATQAKYGQTAPTGGKRPDDRTEEEAEADEQELDIKSWMSKEDAKRQILKGQQTKSAREMAKASLSNKKGASAVSRLRSTDALLYKLSVADRHVQKGKKAARVSGNF